MVEDDIKLPPEFISTNSIPVTVATIKRERMEEIIRDAIKADRQRRSVPVACHRCAEYAKELQELRKDAERLDWLADPENSIGNVQLTTVCVERNLHSLRDAIDDAMLLMMRGSKEK